MLQRARRSNVLLLFKHFVVLECGSREGSRDKRTLIVAARQIAPAASRADARVCPIRECIPTTRRARFRALPLHRRQSRSAPVAVGCPKVVEMEPCVCSILNSLHDRSRLVRRPRVRDVEIISADRWPENRTPCLGLDREAESREVRGPSLLHVREIEEQCEHSRAEREVEVRWDEIMVNLVILPVLVPKHLQELRVELRAARQVAYALRDAGDARQPRAVTVAP
mmetsp:Transcript_7/g.37  ORF Transcript_7/g.37 Transcript_7/m.37 type:complete len:225 (-) Transcript_7:493-1167(-)|eukprot:scaffold38135_cov31-Tisochrysis_lutea.AAC.2